MSHYFDSAQQQDIQALAHTFTGRTQWPTWLLLIAVPSAWFALMLASPVLSVGMLRSFYEHRPAARPEQRTVLNEAGWPWTWLFLNLNLHLVHHDLPRLPWFYMPRVYRARREQWQQRSGHYVVHGYGELIRRHAVHAIDSPKHPFV